MSIRHALVCLLCLLLAAPLPAMSHHGQAMAAGADTATNANPEPLPPGSGATAHVGCPGHAAADPVPDTGMAATNPTTSPTDTSDCCAGGCDCGCLSTASLLARPVTGHEPAPIPAGASIASGIASGPGARLLRPPIAG